MSDKPGNHNIRRAVIITLAVVVLIIGSLWAGTRSFDKGVDLPAATPSPVAGGKGGDAASITMGAGVNLAYTEDSEDMSRSFETGAAPDGGVPLPDDGRKIVRAAGLTLNTTVYDADLAALKALLEGAGGYLSDFYERGDVSGGDTRYATLSMRVPSAGLDAFLTGVEGIGCVVSRSESATDMTVQYADNEARLGTLKTKLQRLNELMLKAETTSDIIEIESAISDTQYDIDRYETIKRTIDRDVDMSEVTVTLREETPAESAAATDTSLGARLIAALRASFIGIGDFLRDMLVFIVMALPVIIPLAIALLVIVLCRRRARARAKQAEAAEDKPSESAAGRD